LIQELELVRKNKITFQPFTQADTTITRKFGGSGLGLSISKHLIEMMKGAIQVRSDEEKGSEFIFTLQLPVVREKATIPTQSQIFSASNYPSKQKSLNILIVDDSEDNRKLIRAYLKNKSHNLIDADNGQNAIELYKKYKPDLVLMDIQMPIIDGLTATRRNTQNRNTKQLEKSTNLGFNCSYTERRHASKYRGGLQLTSFKAIY